MSRASTRCERQGASLRCSRRRLRERASRIAAAALSVFALGQFSTPASGGTFWDPAQTPATPSGGTGTWDLSSSFWSDGVATDNVWTDTDGTGTVATFGGTTGTVSLGSNLGALGMVFTTAGYTLQSGAGGPFTLTLGASGIDASTLTTGTTTLAANMNLTLAADQTWAAGTGSTLTVNAPITGTNAISKTGGGVLLLGGANTAFSGAVNVKGGVVRITASNNLGDGSATNTLTLDGGTLRDAGTGVDLGATRTVQINAGGGVFDVLGTNVLTLSGTLAGTGTLNKTDGGTLVISGNNSGFSGAVTVDSNGASTAGTLLLNNSGALGTSTGVTLSNSSVAGGTGTLLDLQGGTTISGIPLTFNTAATGNFREELSATGATANGWNGNLVVNGDGLAQLATNTAGGSLTIGTLGSTTITPGTAFTGTLFLRGGAGTGFINSTISIPSGNVNKTDTGTWVINSTGNSWVGTVDAVGTLQIGATNALPTTVTLTMGQNDANNAVFDLNGFNQTVASLTLSSTGGTKTITNNSASSASVFTVNNASGNVSNYGGATGLITNGGTGTLGLSVVKNGAGTLILGGANTFANGLTLSAGILRGQTNAGALGAGTLALQSGELQLGNDTSLAFNRNTTISGSVKLTADRATAGSGAAINFTMGTLGIDTTAGNPTITVANGANVNAGNAGITFGATSITGSGTPTFTLNGGILTLGAITGGTAGISTAGSAGQLILSGGDTYAGTTTVGGGVVRLANANSLPGGTANAGGASALTITGGGVLELGAADFLRSLGTGAANVQFLGSGGFSAQGAARNVNIGGAGAAMVVGTTPNFIPAGSILTLGSNFDDNTVTFVNPLDITASPSGTLNVLHGTGTNLLDAVLSGALTITGGGGLTKTGNGIVQLSAASAYSGATTVTGGGIAFSASNQLGDGSATNSISLSGGATLRDTGTPVDLGANRSITVGTGGGVFDVTASNVLTISAPITAGANQIKKTSSTIVTTAGTTATVGTVVFGGTTANTNTVPVVDQLGIIQLNKPAGVDAIGAGGLTIDNTGLPTNDGGTLVQLLADNQINDNGPVVIRANSSGVSATLDLNNHVETIGNIGSGSGVVLTIGATTNQGAWLSTGATGKLTLNGDLTFNADRSGTGDTSRAYLITGSGTTATAAANGTLDLAGGTRTITVNSAVTPGVNSQNDDALIETVVQNGGIIKAGTRALILSNANTFTGGITVNAGKIVGTNAAAFGTGAVNLSAGTELAAGNVTIGNVINLTGANAILSGAVGNNGTLTGNINTNGNNFTVGLRDYSTTDPGVTQTARNLTISGNIFGNGGSNFTGVLTVTSPTAATLTLKGNAVKTFAGSFLLQGGAGLSIQGILPTATTVAGTAGVNTFYYNFGANNLVASALPVNYAVDQLYVTPRVFGRTDSTISLPQAGASGMYPITPVPGFGLAVTGGIDDGVMWKGLLNITTGGNYQFSGTDDDNSVLYIDGQQIGTLGVTSANASIGGVVALSAGPHTIVYKQFQAGSGGYGTLSYNGGPGSDAPTTVIVGSVPGSLTTGTLINPLGAQSFTNAAGAVAGALDLGTDSTASSLTIGGTATSTFTVTSPAISDLNVTGTTTLNMTGTNVGLTLAASTGSLTFNAPITGAGSTGTGTLTIAGGYRTSFNAINTYSGSTTVTGGELDLNASGTNATSGAIPGALIINAPNTGGAVANVRLKQSEQIVDSASVTVTSGIFDLGAFNETIGSLTMNGTNPLLASITGTGTLTVGSLATSSFTGGGAIFANLAGSGGITVASNSTLWLAGNNTFAGPTAINSGAVRISNVNALGATGAANNTTVASGAQLQLLGNLTGINETLGVSGTGLAGSGAIRGIGGTQTFLNTVTLGAASTIESDGGSLQFLNASAAIDGSANNASLTIQGPGDVIFGGPVTLGAGTLTKGGTGSLTFAYPLSAIPTMTWGGGVLGFTGPQNLGAVTVGTTSPALAWQFNSDPGAGTTVTVPAGTTLRAGYAADQTLLSRVSPTSTGGLILTVNDSNPLNFSAGPNLALGALGLVNYSGALTPNGTTYQFSGPLVSGIAPNVLTLANPLTGANSATVSGGILNLSQTTNDAGFAGLFSGGISANGGVTRYVNDPNLGTAAGVVNLNGGTLSFDITNVGSVAGQFGYLGTGINNSGRFINVGAAGGTLDVVAQSSGGTGLALTQSNSITGGASATLTKTGFGQLLILAPNDATAGGFSGNLVVASNGGTVNILSAGDFKGLASITVNQSGTFQADNNTTIGQGRQFAFNAQGGDKVSNSTPITLNGGTLLLAGRNVAFGATAGNAETFGTVTLGLGQSFIQANRNGGGGTDLVVSNLIRNYGGGTVRFVGGANGTGVVAGMAGDATRIVLSQINGVAPSANQFVGGWATVGGTDFGVYQIQSAAGAAGGVVAYGATGTGLTVPGYTALTAATAPGTGGWGTGVIGNAAANTALGNAAAGQQFVVGALRFSLNAGQTLTFTDTTGTPDTLFIESGGLLSDGQNQARTIGATTSTFTRGILTAGLTTATTPQELFIHNNSNTLTIDSQIIDNPSSASATVALVKDLDGAATIDFGSNTYSGGTTVLRGTLTANNTGSLGTGVVTVKNSTLNLGTRGSTTGTSATAGAAANAPVYTTFDNAEIVLTNGTNGSTSQYTAAGDRFSISTGSTIYANSPGAGSGLNSLTRIASPSSFTGSGQVFLAPGSIVRHNMTNAPDQGTGILTIQNLGTNADLYFSPGNAGGILQTVTVGAGTPWMGISTDRNSSGWTTGTIYANSDFNLQGLVRDGGLAVLTLGLNGSTGSYSIVNNAGKPINAFVMGQVALDEDTPVSMPSDLTFVVTPGAILQPNRVNSFGDPLNNGGTGGFAKVLVQAGGTLDPGNFVAVGANANQPLGMPYPVPSPTNANVTIEAGGRFLLNDASGAGSTTNGNQWLIKTDGILDLQTASAFLGSNAGLINSGQFVYQPGAIVRLEADNIFRISQFVNGEPNGAGLVYELFNGSRTLTNQTNPFIAAAVGTPTIAPESIRIGTGGMLTNDTADRQVNQGRGLITLGDGSTIAGTSQTFLNIQQDLVVEPGANVTIGSTKYVDGMPKNGGVQLLAPNSNTIPASANVSVAPGSILSFNAANVWSDAASLNLPGAVTFGLAGAAANQPGSGSSLLLNTQNFTEVIGPLTGNGAVIGNTTGTAIATGFGASADFTSNVVFSNANGQTVGLTKIGATNMTLTNVSTSTASLIAEQGTLTIAQTGQTVFAQERTLRGATLTLDDASATLAAAGTAQTSAVRFGGTVAAPLGSVAPGGGSFVINGGATSVTESIGNLFNSVGNANNVTLNGDYSYVNLNAGSGTLTLLAQTLENPTAGGIATQRNGVWVVRSASVANTPGSYSTAGTYSPASGVTNGLLVAQFPNLFSQGAVVASAGGNITGAAGTPVAPTRPDYLGDTSASGQGVGFMTEDAVLLAATEAATNNTLTNLANTAGISPGMLVSGANIPVGTVVTATTATTITLSNNASAAGTVTVGFIPAGGGMRLLAASEYAPTVASNVTSSVNSLLSGTVNITGDSRVQTLTLTPGSALNINGTLPLNSTPSRLVLSAPAVLTQAGAASSINGGTNAFLQAPTGNSLYFHTFGDLNLNAIAFSDNDIVKTNAGTLNVGSGDFSAFRGALTVEGGTVNLGSNNSFYVTRGSGQGATSFTGQNLYMNGGTLNLGGNSQLVNLLGNSNPLPGAGGTITSSAPATFTVQGGGSFSGSFSGAIALDKVSNNTLLLTGANSNTGATTILQGTLQLRDQGTLTGTTGLDLRYGVLQLDDSSLANVPNRVPANINVTSSGGTVSLVGTGGQVASQTFQQLALVAGLTTINSNAGGGGANVVTINNLVHNPDTTINFVQNFGFLGTAGNTTTAIRDFVPNINSSPLSLTFGIIGGWAIANGDHFATYNTNTGVGIYGNTADGYATEESTVLSTATATQNVSDAATAETIPGHTVNSVRLAPAAAATLQFAGNTAGAVAPLVLNTGGLITNANFAINLTAFGTTSATSTSLTSNTGELDVWVNQNTTTLSTPITGSLDLVKSGPNTLTLAPSVVNTLSSTTTAGVTVTVASTAGLAPGMTVTGTNIPGGDTIASITSGTTYNLVNAASAAATNTLTYGATPGAVGNTYSGSTYVNGGTLNLNMTGANAGTLVAVPSANVFVQNATLTELQPGQINPNASIFVTGGGRFNVNSPTTANTYTGNETFASITMTDASGTTNAVDGLDRTTSQPGATVTLTAPTAITATNTNPTTTPFMGAFVGTVNFTNATGSTLNITAPTTTNGLGAIGLVFAPNVGNVPTGVTGGGLIKAGTGMLALNPGNTTTQNVPTVTSGSNVIVVPSTTGLFIGQNVSGTGIPAGTYILSMSGTTLNLSQNATAAGTNIVATFQTPSLFNNPASLTDEFNVTQGIVRVDQFGALGLNTVNTNVQSGAGILGDVNTNPVTGSITLKDGSFLSVTLNSTTFGAATTTVANQSILNVPSGNVTMYAEDYLLPATNGGTITLNGHLTGAGNINLVGPLITGTTGTVQLGNPITSGTGSNDYSGTITANVNTILQSQQAKVLPATSITGNDLGSASIILNGGRLRLRDDFSTTNAAAANQVASYGNNVSLAANSSSFLDANNATGNAGTINNTINLGTLTVPSGTETLTVDSGNGYAVGFNLIDGPGTLIKAGASALNINGVAGTFTGGITLAGPLGLAVVPSQALNFTSATTTIPSLTVNGLYTGTAAKAVTVSGTLTVGNNAGTVVNGLNGVTTGSTVGVLSLPATTVTAGTLVNNGIIASTAATAAVNATTIAGSGFYQTFGQPLTVAGALSDVSGTFKVSGDNVVNFLPTAAGVIGKVQVQSGTLHVAPSTSGIAPFGGSTIAVLNNAPDTILTASQPVSTSAATLQFDPGASNTVQHLGNITNNGTVVAMTGTTTVSGPIAGTPTTFTPGLLEGRIAAPTFSATTPLTNPGQFGVKLEPRMGQDSVVTQSPLTGWSNNEAWVYTGQFRSASPTFSFIENIDDDALVSIDGKVVLANTGFNTVTSTAYTVGQTTTTANQGGANGAPAANVTASIGMGPASDGWHTITIEFQNGGGGAGPVTSNGFFANFGFGLNPTGAGPLDGTSYVRPIDPGDGSVFRTPSGGSGLVTVNAGATLNAGGISLTSKLTLNTTSTANAAFGDTSTSATDNVDQLLISGAAGTGTVSVANAPANLTVNAVGGLTVPAATTLAKTGPGTLTVLGTGTTTATSNVALNAGTLSFANSSLGLTGTTLSQITFTGSSTLQWHDTNTQDVSPQIQPIPASTTATFDTNGNAVSFANGLTGAGNIAKTGLGSLALTGTNTHNGSTTVQQGTLALVTSANNNVASSPKLLVGDTLTHNAATLDVTGVAGTGGFQVVQGQTLTGFGNVNGGTTVNALAFISAGDGSSIPGKLTVNGNLALTKGSGAVADATGNGATYNWKINDATGTQGATAGLGWDNLAVSTLSVTGTGSVVTIQPFLIGTTLPHFDPNQTYHWNIATVPGTAAGTIPLAANFMLDAPALHTFAQSVFAGGVPDSNFSVGTDPTDVFITYNPAPEPTSMLMLGLGAGGLMLRRRRRAASASPAVAN